VQIEVRECLLSFGAESFVFQVAIQKYMKIKTYRIINLSVVWYGCETWSLIWREEIGLRVFGNRVLWRIFRPSERGMRKIHNEELSELYPYQISFGL
jgi:hypothetical protein